MLRRKRIERTGEIPGISDRQLLDEIAKHPPKLHLRLTALPDVPGPTFIGTDREPPIIKPRKRETAYEYWTRIVEQAEAHGW